MHTCICAYLQTSNSSSKLLDEAVMQCKLGGESGYYDEEGDVILGGDAENSYDVHEDDGRI